jgi:hypothetical protein
VTGRCAAVLERGRRAAGEHAVRVDPRRLGLAAGVYLCRLQAGGEAAGGRLVLAR